MLTRQLPPQDFEWSAESIRALRNHLGQSQSSLAKELGIRQQTVSEWETGMYRPRGASVTILNLLAVSSNFSFESAEPSEESDRPARRPDSRDMTGPTVSRATPAPRRSPSEGPVEFGRPVSYQPRPYEASNGAAADPQSSDAAGRARSDGWSPPGSREIPM